MSSERFDELPGGREVRACTLRVADGSELTVLDLGATVQRLRVPDGDGHLHDVALEYDDVASYLSASNPYVRATVGRYANRIADARFTLDGATHRLSANEGGTCLHGALTGSTPEPGRLTPSSCAARECGEPPGSTIRRAGGSWR